MKYFSACVGAAMCCAGAHLANAATAEAYPEKPIRMIVPFLPGGGTDIVARLVAARLTETIGWQFVFDNRPGAGGSIGVELAAKPATWRSILISIPGCRTIR